MDNSVDVYGSKAFHRKLAICTANFDTDLRLALLAMYATNRGVALSLLAENRVQ